MPTTVMGMIRSEIRRIVDRRQKPPKRLERRLANLEAKIRALGAAVRKAGRRPVIGARGAAPAADAPNGAQIRALRERMGLTREVFAKRLQVSPSIIFLWESGRSRPSRRANVEALQKLFRGAGASGRGVAKAGKKGAPAIDGRVIRDVRARLGLSREKFAKRVGVSPSMIFLWESGRSAPRRRANLEKLQALAGEAGGGGMRAQRAARRNAGKRGRRRRS